MNLTKLIKRSIEADELYQKARLEYEANHYGEFDHHAKGLRLNGERLKANEELEAYVAKLQDNRENSHEAERS